MSAKKTNSRWYTSNKRKMKNKVIQSETLPDGRLFAQGIYPSKMTAEKLPESFVEVWNYGQVYIDCSGLTDIKYSPNYYSDNHLFKDDFLYLSWTGKIEEKQTRYGSVHAENYDKLIWGNAIPEFIEHAIPFYDGKMKKRLLGIKKTLDDKVVWFCHMNPDRMYTSMMDGGPVVDVTYVIRPMNKMKRPATQKEQRAVLDAFCERNKCRKVGEVIVRTREDVEKLTAPLKTLEINEPMRPVFLYVITQQFCDPKDDVMESELFRYMRRDKCTLCSVFLKKNAKKSSDANS